MSSRRNGSVSRAAEAASKSRLHMDRNPQHARITDPANPAGRRKEIDNVMKRARQASPGSWDRKLLEVEEKDPNRWRHTGYKQLYLEAGSVSPRRSVSPQGRRSRSPIGRRSRSPIMPRRSRSPLARRSRSPLGRRSRSPIRRERSPLRREREPVRRSPRRSPPARRSVAGRAARPRSPPRRTPPRPERPARPPQRPQANRPPEPPPRPSSGSGSSTGSCSDESCSVCSAKNKKQPPPPKSAAKPPPPPRPRSASPRRARPPAPPASRAVQPTRELLKAREASKRSREEKAELNVPAQRTRELLKAREASKRSREKKVLEWQRSQLATNPRPAPPIPPGHIKREGERRPPAPPRPRRPPGPRPVSPAAIAAALADSGEESESDASENVPPRLTLSERFGKMAQWSADRSARLENMRITRRDSSLHVSYIDRGNGEADRPDLPELDSAPVGSYPEELLAVAPAGLSWDDVRVRYDYYKKRGYLRGLTLADYVKWEDWWYKYQEWLKRERAYERWADSEVTVRRERRRRGGRHRRS